MNLDDEFLPLPPKRKRREAGETRSAQIAQTLRETITQGGYYSGERLVELTLARQYSVSQNTVRDALRILENEGWVVKHARHGVYVRKFAPEDVEEMVAVIAAVEAVALNWASNGTVRRRLANRLAELLGDARRKLYAGDHVAAMNYLFDLHQQLAGAQDRNLTHSVLETLYNQVRLLEVIQNARAPRTVREIEDEIAAHERAIKTLEAGDHTAAQKLLSEFLTRFYERTNEVLRLQR